ncbi:hypothetical protein F5Y01DRAFT_109567 [Xylaria sp. FL0043]|nr:hypothetical protein F5Y01DRAFT_109567 [Xylaria sp. FL0043]
MVMSIRSLASRSALGAPPLTRIHTNIRAPSLLINDLRKINACKIQHYSIESRKAPSTSTRLLSSSSASLSDKNNVTSANAGKDRSAKSQSRPNNDRTSTPSEDGFKVSFRDLGMNRITKFVVYATIGVLGTMETIFWCKALWRWWTGGEEDNE